MNTQNTGRIAAISMALFAIVMVFGSNVAFAANNGRPLNYTIQILDSAYAHASCKTNFTATYVGQIVALVPGMSNISSQVTILQQDTSQLQTYAQAGNTSGFDSYVIGTYDPQLKTISQDVKAGFKSNNITNSTRQTIRSDRASDLVVEENCSFSALKQFATARIGLYQYYIGQYSNQTKVISRFNISTANLTALLNNANATIILPLQNALQNSTNSSQLEAALNQYCLFNGCAGGISDHLAAHFVYSKVGIILGAVEQRNPNYNKTEAQAATSDLNNASATLQQVGTQKYQDGQSVTIWSNLRNAGREVRHMIDQFDATLTASKTPSSTT